MCARTRGSNAPVDDLDALSTPLPSLPRGTWWSLLHVLPFTARTIVSTRGEDWRRVVVSRVNSSDAAIRSAEVLSAVSAEPITRDDYIPD